MSFWCKNNTKHPSDSDQIPIKDLTRTGFRPIFSMKASIQGYGASLVNPKFAPTGIKVALMVGSILLVINHGQAVLKGQMSRERWISALLTYCVPYLVSIHGQYSSTLRRQQSHPQDIHSQDIHAQDIHSESLHSANMPAHLTQNRTDVAETVPPK
jgi:hypothetical protein